MHFKNYWRQTLAVIMMMSIFILFKNCNGQNITPDQILTPLACNFDNTTIVDNQPLTVKQNSHLVVMEYMPWFGVNATSFGNSPVTPLLSSVEMEDYLATVVGFAPAKTLDYGGYNSGDRNVIRQHIQWLKAMGVHAILLDNSNQIACGFGNLTQSYCSPGNAAPLNYFNVKGLIENVYIIYDEFSKDGSIKIIPLLGGTEVDSTIVMSNGKNPLKEQVHFYQNLMASYPNLNVIYENKPLITAFVAVDALTREANVVSTLSEFQNSLTIKIMGGMLESQPGTHKGIGLSNLPKVSEWSWWDRYNNAHGLLPTYADNNGRAEAFTAVVAVPGTTSARTKFQKLSKQNYGPETAVSDNIWGSLPDDCIYVAGVDSTTKTKCIATKLPDALGYNNGKTITSYFDLAKKLRPTFLFIHEFNGFTSSDGGLDVELNTDIEPTLEWRHTRKDFITGLIIDYKNSLKCGP